MILIQEVLVSSEIVSKHFACNLIKCKGACCVEGDYGAPLEDEEVPVIEKLLPKVKKYLNRASKKVLSEEGFCTYNKKEKSFETVLVDGGACVLMGTDQMGITYCSIEKAYRAGEVDFKKPISCHLYPIRVSKNKKTGFEALNYDVWDICNAACDKGKKNKIKIYEFTKEALVRKYGIDFYEELEAAALELGS